MKKERMTPAWERIWCAKETAVVLDDDRGFVPKPIYLNMPQLNLVGWHYMGEFITAVEARETFKELGIEVPEELKKYLPPEEDEEGPAPRTATHPSATIHE